jgi:hypothetical protein
MRGLPVIVLVLLVWGLILAGLRGYAQEKTPVTFGTVTAADFGAVPGVDTAADAVVIADVGTGSFDRTTISVLGWERYFRQFKRVKIMHRQGFDAATVFIPLFIGPRDREEEVKELKATTYYLEGGKVVKTELDKNSIFKEKVSENLVLEKFTFPAIREGCIVEFSYTKRSPFLSPSPWEFQGKYPCLWSEYQFAVPSVLSCSWKSHSYLHYYIDTSVSEPAVLGPIYGSIRTYRWVIRNVPVMTEEPYTTTIMNYLSRIEVRVGGLALRQNNLGGGFYTMSLQSEGSTYNWRQVNLSLLKTDKFGADLTADNSWLDKDMAEITAGTSDELGKARRIYQYVRDHFTCTPQIGIVMSNPLKTIYKNRSGSEAELNLLLTAMLYREKLATLPAVLSTRSNGFFDLLQPQLYQLNYVICKVRCGSTVYNLDVGDPNIGFGQLPLKCYNGYDVPVDPTNIYPEVLSADSVTEQKKVIVFLTNGEKGGLDGSVQCFPGLAEAAEIRKQMKEPDGEKKFREELRSGSAVDETISDLEIDSLKMPDEPLAINYSYHLATDSTSDVFYFTPMLMDRIVVNPFKATWRRYPVEMPYARDVNYILTMDIPGGYRIDEIPKSEKLTFTDGSYFEYVMTVDSDQIHFRTRTRLMHANYEPQAYDVLREFFAHIVKKESEQIVFKKKK